MPTKLLKENARRVLGLSSSDTLHQHSDHSYTFRFNRSRDLTQTEDTLRAKLVNAARAEGFALYWMSAAEETYQGAFGTERIIVLRFTLERTARPVAPAVARPCRPCSTGKGRHTNACRARQRETAAFKEQSTR